MIPTKNGNIWPCSFQEDIKNENLLLDDARCTTHGNGQKLIGDLKLHIHLKIVLKRKQRFICRIAKNKKCITVTNYKR